MGKDEAYLKYQNNKNDNESNERDNNLQKREDDIMPTLELIEPDKANLIDEMTNYFEKLKKMKKDDAIKTSRKNLLDAGIIDETGKLTDRYKYSRDDKR